MATTTASPGFTSRPHRTLHVSLWVVQALLAVLFGMAGLMKTTMPIHELAAQMDWVGDVPAALVRFIGVSELAAAFGLILPAATRIKPALTPLAALGLVLIMVFAAVFHLMRGETNMLPINILYGALAAFVAWGRTRRVPITPRDTRDIPV